MSIVVYVGEHLSIAINILLFLIWISRFQIYRILGGLDDLWVVQPDLPPHLHVVSVTVSNRDHSPSFAVERDPPRLETHLIHNLHGSNTLFPRYSLTLELSI